jgi:hypothetical protein
MQHAATWDFAPAVDEKRLAELMSSFGCTDVIATVDAEAFGKRAGELIARVVRRPRAVPRTEKPIQSTTSAATERSSFLKVLEHAPWSDRLTLSVAASASASMLIAGAALLE